MALISSIKRCLGLVVTDDEEDYEALAAEARHTGVATPPFNQPDPNKAIVRPVDIDPLDDDDDISTANHQATNDGAARLSDLLVDIVRNSIASPRFAKELSRYTATARPSGEFQAERERLLAEIKKLKEQSSSNSMLTNEINNLRLSAQRQQRAYTDRINELLEQINLQAGRKNSPDSSLPDPLIAQLQESLEAREKTIRELNETISALNMKVKMGDEMINSLNKKAAEARNELIESSRRYDEKIETLEGQLADANSIIDSLNMRLQMVAANSEATPATPEVPAADERKRHRGRKRKKNAQPEKQVNAIDNTLDDTSWLVAEPTEEAMKDLKEKRDTNFGYNEPNHKDSSASVDDRQMSLF